MSDERTDTGSGAARDKMTVVYCRPGRLAQVCQIGTGLKDMQEAVRGYIQPYYCFDGEPAVIVCNENGKFDGSDANRAVYGEDKQVMDIIFGPFFICGLEEGDFISLTEEQQERFRKQFEKPEHFFRAGDKIKAVSYTPQFRAHEER